MKLYSAREMLSILQFANDSSADRRSQARTMRSFVVRLWDVLSMDDLKNRVRRVGIEHDQDSVSMMVSFVSGTVFHVSISGDNLIAEKRGNTPEAFSVKIDSAESMLDPLTNFVRLILRNEYETPETESEI